MTDLFLNLAEDESRRRLAMLEASPDFDPVHALTVQTEANRLLYSNLDEQQQRIYEELVEAGVLP